MPDESETVVQATVLHGVLDTKSDVAAHHMAEKATKQFAPLALPLPIPWNPPCHPVQIQAATTQLEIFVAVHHGAKTLLLDCEYFLSGSE